MIYRWLACCVVVLLCMLTGACDRLPALPELPGNPFAAAPTVVEATPTTPPRPTPVPPCSLVEDPST